MKYYVRSNKGVIVALRDARGHTTEVGTEWLEIDKAVHDDLSGSWKTANRGLELRMERPRAEVKPMEKTVDKETK